MVNTTAPSDRARDLTDKSRRHGLLEYWHERAAIEAPSQKAVPFCWRWSNILPLLREAAEIVPVEQAHRRALLFANPGLAPRPYITTTLYGACSLYNPGETAEVHRHMSSASRFVHLRHGLPPRRLLRLVLLGSDDAPVRRRHHERLVDRRLGRFCSGRKDCAARRDNGACRRLRLSRWSSLDRQRRRSVVK